MLSPPVVVPGVRCFFPTSLVEWLRRPGPTRAHTAVHADSPACAPLDQIRPHVGDTKGPPRRAPAGALPPPGYYAVVMAAVLVSVAGLRRRRWAKHSS